MINKAAARTGQPGRGGFSRKAEDFERKLFGFSVAAVNLKLDATSKSTMINQSTYRIMN